MPRLKPITEFHSEGKKPIHPTKLVTEVLLFLAHQDGRWATWGKGYYMPSVQQVFKVGTTTKAQLKFMQKLQKAGLVGGCDCGCRGDYVPTQAGLELLAKDCISGQQELERWNKEKFSRRGY
jgi:hypothetical protein